MKRFRFSLLSLVVGVVLAGGVVWLNMRGNIYPELLPFEVAVSSGDPSDEPTVIWTGERVIRSSGWPWCFCSVPRFLNLSEKPPDVPLPREVFQKRWSWPSLSANIAIGLAIVFGGAGVCEYVVRRRSAKAKE